MTDHPPTVLAAIERARPNPIEVARLRDEFLANKEPGGGYWSLIACMLQDALAEVNDAHLNTCTTDPCPTCIAIGRAVAVYDAMEDAEDDRCPCTVRDHFTFDCVDKATDK